MHYRAVIISPHLDDAVFTCGGQMKLLIKEGPVLVLNLFTHYLGDVKDRAIVMADDRFDEERISSQFFGYTRNNFGELEAYFRRKPYQALSNIFHPPVAEDTGEYLTLLREKVFAYLDGIEYDELYVPLGVGWHVDHILTFMLFEPWIGKKKMLFYEDIPYTLIPHALRYRLNEIGTYEKINQDKTLAPLSRIFACFSSAYAYFNNALMKNLKPPLMRWVATPVVCYYFYKLMARHTSIAKKNTPRYTLKSVVLPIDDFSHKLEAMALYQGQFREFFVDSMDCLNLFTTYAQQIDPTFKPVERFWEITPLTNDTIAHT
ncbi:MAG: hypothetical protein PHH40_04205 [Candidatus Moranbacteria bacterium]|nr:hypothetical protein [Candidatus Moranbacteria bacterium]MDD3964560.1 hypothetical protein [Candidatus Moranbacteria bacterium]